MIIFIIKTEMVILYASTAKLIFVEDSIWLENITNLPSPVFLGHPVYIQNMNLKYLVLRS